MPQKKIQKTRKFQRVMGAASGAGVPTVIAAGPVHLSPPKASVVPAVEIPSSIAVEMVSPDFAGWIASVTFDEDANPVRFELKRRTNQEGPWGKLAPTSEFITRRFIRDFPFGSFVDAARLELKDLSAPKFRQSWAQAAARVRKPGRVGIPDINYVHLASAYLRGLAEGKTVAAIAESLGLTQQQLSNRMVTARTKKLLTKPGRGRSTGQLTDKAKALLKEASSGEH